MQRDIESALIAWKNSSTHLPILLRGARQVGKSYLVERFAEAHFDHVVTVNFELFPDLKSVFSSLDPHELIKLLGLRLSADIIPGKTLLFLDEIQECPNAIMALRYFKEKMPDLHVIAAGSLLEFALADESFRMPVGRVQFFYVKPLSFKEFLNAKGLTKLRLFIEEVDWKTAIPEPIHQQLLGLVKEYSVLGGMPAVVNEYLHHNSYQAAQNMQNILLSTYENDFAKYAKGVSIEHLRMLFRKIPNQVAQQFKYSHITQEVQSRELKLALQKLIRAYIAYPVYATSASGLPLNALINEKKFKLLFLDIGLIRSASHLAAELLLSEGFSAVNKGALAEQFVGQELLAYQDLLLAPELFFWARDKKNANAELDFVTQVEGEIVPIEVKSGAYGSLKSLQLFMNEHASRFGIRVSTHPFSAHEKLLSIPFYLVSEIARLYRAL